MSQNRAHVPVLLQSVIEYLRPRPGGRYIDATVGAGGHTTEIAQACVPDGRVLGIDADPNALAMATANLAYLGSRVVLKHANFADLRRLAVETGFFPSDGILLDLGISSLQLADEARGFSFKSEHALDMRFNPQDATTAADLVNSLSEEELADLLFKFGEEHASRRIARAIVSARPLATAAQLADVVERAVGRHGRIHPATRTFQALRIAVNRELSVLEEALPQIVQTLGPGGRVVIITFHSLEDRIVKVFFRQSEALRVLTKHPVRPGREELQVNPRSRSAKLRAAARIA